MKKLLTIVLALILALVPAACGGNPESAGTARTIDIFRIVGENAAIMRNGSETAAREGLKLSGGDTAATGAASNIYLNLNGQSLLKMDETSKVEVSRISERSLSLTLLEGAISADITRESDDDTYEIRAGSKGLAIRGTSFVVEYRGANPVFIMLIGTGEIDGKPLTAGNAAAVTADEITIEPIVINDDLSAFVLGEIVERGEKLTDNDTFSQGDIDRAAELLSEKPAQNPPQTETDPGGTGAGETNTAPLLADAGTDPDAVAGESSSTVAPGTPEDTTPGDATPSTSTDDTDATPADATPSTPTDATPTTPTDATPATTADATSTTPAGATPATSATPADTALTDTTPTDDTPTAPTDTTPTDDTPTAPTDAAPDNENDAPDAADIPQAAGFPVYDLARVVNENYSMTVERPSAEAYRIVIHDDYLAETYLLEKPFTYTCDISILGGGGQLLGGARVNGSSSPGEANIYSNLIYFVPPGVNINFDFANKNIIVTFAVTDGSDAEWAVIGAAFHITYGEQTKDIQISQQL